MNRNNPHTRAAACAGVPSARSTTRGGSMGSLLAVAVAIITTVVVTLFATGRATGRGTDDDARRIEKICVANGGYWVRTGAGGACIDISETAP